MVRKLIIPNLIFLPSHLPAPLAHPFRESCLPVPSIFFIHQFPEEAAIPDAVVIILVITSAITTECQAQLLGKAGYKAGPFGLVVVRMVVVAVACIGAKVWGRIEGDSGGRGGIGIEESTREAERYVGL